MSTPVGRGPNLDGPPGSPVGRGPSPGTAPVGRYLQVPPTGGSRREVPSEPALSLPKGASNRGAAGQPPSAPALSDGSEPFSGFPNSPAATVVPSLFFSRVLPQIDACEELVVSVYFFFAQQQTRRQPRFLSRRELAADGTLARALLRLCSAPQDALARGLALALRRGTLFRTTVRAGERGEELFAVNTPANRKALGALDAGSLSLAEPLPPAQAEAAPNIFALYEQNVGGITPLIAEDLKEAEQRYPAAWIHAAFREAVALNKRNWRYIERILRRWETEGPDYEEAGRDSQVDWLERRYSQAKRGARRRAAPGLG
ncbi:MAG: DnaD domain protein [Dehalococcoidia bacterium]|nr:DnaD domain protein [Dehalococcoidia bacterium]